MRPIVRASLIASTMLVCAGSTASAGIVYTFCNITNNNPTDAAAGEAQLFVDVQPFGINQVSFQFLNTGAASMSITDIYFDDGALLGIASIIEGAGVEFDVPASPPDLPGGNTISPAFNVTAGFSADSDPPAQPNGVNPGETVTIVFDLIGGMDFLDVIDGLDGGIDLRIGIHVQGFAGGGSESFVNKVPAPGAAGLFGLAGLCAARRRRR